MTTGPMGIPTRPGQQGPLQDLLGQLGNNPHTRMSAAEAWRFRNHLIRYGVPREEAQALADYLEHRKVPGAPVRAREYA